jgi:hypothetical protein
MDLRNSIMEEVILKNYKLLQYVENEMKQLKDEIKLLKEENSYLKEENKINKNLFCSDIQNIQDTIENTIIIGYDILYKHISLNIDKAFLIPSFKEYTILSDLFNRMRCQGIIIIMSSKVFKHFNKFNNFNTFKLLISDNFIDENFNEICIKHPHGFDNSAYFNVTPNIGTEYNDNGTIYIKLNTATSNENWFHKQNLKKLLDILDECNIKLYINRYDCNEVHPSTHHPQKTIRELINL